MSAGAGRFLGGEQDVDRVLVVVVVLLEERVQRQRVDVGEGRAQLLHRQPRRQTLAPHPPFRLPLHGSVPENTRKSTVLLGFT